MSDLTDRHGGPKDRGAADAYYDRPARPHKYEGATYQSERIELTDPAEIAAYLEAYHGQTGRKDWGV